MIWDRAAVDENRYRDYWRMTEGNPAQKIQVYIFKHNVERAMVPKGKPTQLAELKLVLFFDEKRGPMSGSKRMACDPPSTPGSTH